jgi:hypothetical protein
MKKRHSDHDLFMYFGFVLCFMGLAIISNIVFAESYPIFRAGENVQNQTSSVANFDTSFYIPLERIGQ